MATIKNIKLQTPTVPNFVKAIIAGKEVQIPVRELDAETIDELARQWRDALVAKANEPRED